jgi:hypothetical protein
LDFQFCLGFDFFLIPYLFPTNGPLDRTETKMNHITPPVFSALIMSVGIAILLFMAACESSLAGAEAGGKNLFLCKNETQGNF